MFVGNQAQRNENQRIAYINPNSIKPTPFLKERLIEKKLIDQFFNTIGVSKFPPLGDIEKTRLLTWLKKPIKLSFGEIQITAPIHDVLFTALNAVSKLPFADNMRIKFVGSFVLSILGRSYVESLFLHNGISLKDHFTEEEWNDFEREFNKTHRDIDLSIELPKANEKNREIIRSVIIKAFIPFVANYAKKPEKEVEPHVQAHLSPPLSGNIVDGNTRYLRTPLGTKELMLDINWFESKGREKLFEEDDIAFEANLALFANPDKMHEIVPSVSTQTLKPFIDILFNLITVSDPFTVNKRGWAKMVLKELKGKKVLIEKDALTLFNTAFSLFLKGIAKTPASFSENFSSLIDFCHKEHTPLDFSSHFLLYLQGISNLYYFQNRKGLICEYKNNDIEAIKTEMLKIPAPKNKEGILELLYSYLDDKEMTVDIIFDLLTLYRDEYGLTFFCQNVKYTLDLKGRRTHDLGKVAQFLIKKINKDNITQTELALSVAVNRFVPKPELKEKILFNIHPYLKENTHPISDVPLSVFQTIRENLDRYTEKEAVLRGLFTHTFVFDMGLKWLNKNPELHYLRSSCATLAFNLDPFSGLGIIKTLYADLKPKERKLILKLVFNKLLKATPHERVRFETYLIGFSDLICVSCDPELSFEEYSFLSLHFPILKNALIPLLAAERFHQQEGYLSRISGTPDELDNYFKSFSPSSLKWLAEHSKESSPQVLSILRTLHRMNLVDPKLAFIILFHLKINPSDIPQPLFKHCMDLILETLSKKTWPIDETLTYSRIVDIAKACPKKTEFILSFLELDLPQNPHLSALVECLLCSSLDEKNLRRAWPYAIASSHRTLFLTIALQNENLEGEVFQEMQKTNIEPFRLNEIIYQQMDNRKFRLCCCLIRQFHTALPLDELIPILIGKIKASLIYTDAESLFELFQLPQMRRLKRIHASFVYLKVFQTTSTSLEKRVYSDIRNDFTKDEIIRSLMIPLVRSIGLFNTEEIKPELPYLLDLFKSVSDFSSIKTHLAPLARREIADCEEGRQLISTLSPKSTIFHALETDLLVESSSDDQFLIGMKRRQYKRLPLEYAARLYKLDSKECFEAVRNMQNPTLSEQEMLFDILTYAPLHPQYLALFKEGFFNGLRKSQGKRDRLKRLADTMVAKEGLELCSTPLLKEYLSNNAYHYSLKWRDEIINEKQYESLHQLPLSAYEENDRVPVLQAQFLHREELRPRIIKDVSLLSQDCRNNFFKQMLKTIREGNQRHCLSFFTLFIKSEGFVKNNNVIDLLTLISIYFQSDLKTALVLFITEKMKTIVNLKNYTVNCDEYNISPIDTYQSGEPLVLIPHLDHPTETNIPANIESAFFQVLGQILSKFIVDGVALHRTPHHAGYLLDFVALNLFYRSEYICTSETLKLALEQFLRPVETDIKKYSVHMRNLNLIESSMHSNKGMVFAESTMISNHIYLGNPLFSESLTFSLKPLKAVIENLVHQGTKEKDFAPVCILHALNLIKGYNIDLFRSYPAIRANHCITLFSAIEANPKILNFDELSFSSILNAFFPVHSGLSDQEYFIYSELIQIIRAKCYLLFKSAGLEYLLEAMNLYIHLLEKNYVRNDEHFLNITIALVKAAEESLKLSDASFTCFAKMLKDILCLNLKNDQTLRPLFTPFIKGILNQCMEYFGASDRPIILNFRSELYEKAKEVYPQVFR